MPEIRKVGRYQGKVRLGLDPGGLEKSLGTGTTHLQVRYLDDHIRLEAVNR